MVRDRDNAVLRNETNCWLDRIQSGSASRAHERSVRFSANGKRRIPGRNSNSGARGRAGGVLDRY